MMDHERASELLGPLVRGELDASSAAEVEGHLSGCAECTAERRGLEALLTPLPDDALDDLERARLHSAVTAARPGESPAATSGPWPLVAKWMGAAATIALVVLGATQLDLAGDDGEGAGGSALQEDADGEAAAEALAPLERGGPDIAGSDEADSLAASAETLTDDAAGTVGAARVAARFDGDAGAFRSRDLKRFAAQQPPFTQFALNYSGDDASALSAAYVDALERAVSGARAKATIRTCAELVLQQDFPIIPAYGAYGRFEGHDVLVLGFVFEPPGGDLGNYLVWVWPRDNCDTPLEVLRGRIVR